MTRAPAQRAAIIAAYEAGVPLKIIAYEYGFSGHKAVNAILRVWGVPPLRRPRRRVA